MPQRILIADDDLDFLEAVEIGFVPLLEKVGIVPVLTDSYADALRKIDGEQWNALMLDLRLVSSKGTSDKSGFLLLDRSKNPSIFRIIMSVDEAYAHRVVGARNDIHVVSKIGIDFTKIITLIRDALDNNIDYLQVAVSLVKDSWLGTLVLFTVSDIGVLSRKDLVGKFASNVIEKRKLDVAIRRLRGAHLIVQNGTTISITQKGVTLAKKLSQFISEAH